MLLTPTDWFSLKSSQNELNDSCQKLPQEKQLQDWKLSDMWPEQWIRVLTAFFVVAD